MKSSSLPVNRLALSVALCLGMASPQTIAEDPTTNSCQAGTYLREGATACIPADEGFYVPSDGATEQIPAERGRYVPSTGATSSIPASPGFYVPTTGASAQTEATPGQYVPLSGQSAARAADPGFFVSETGQTAQTIASPGFFVAESGASAATPALLGTYIPGSGATAGIPAGPGTFVDTRGATAPQEAPPGTFTNEFGASSAQTCPIGSASFGGDTACRAGIASVVGDPNVVSPLFGSNFDGDSIVDFSNVSIGESKTIEMTIRNDSNSIGFSNPLTDLTLKGFSFVGAGANLFSLTGFTIDTVLGELETITFDINFNALFTGMFDVNLSFVTDQFALPGESGEEFSFSLLANVNEASDQVSSPTVAGLFLSSFVAFYGLRRRQSRLAKANQ